MAILLAVLSLAVPTDAAVAAVQPPDDVAAGESISQFGSDNPDPGLASPQVSIAASPANPLTGQTARLSASVSNSPPGSSPSFKWQMNLGGSWTSFGSGPTFSYRARVPESWRFRVTVNYPGGTSVTSAPLKISWTDPEPEPAPEPDRALSTSTVERTVREQADVTDLEAGKPGTPTLTRTRFSEPTDPALDVAWTAAAANGTTISAYQAQYRKKVADGETANAWTDYTVDDGNDGQTSALPATTTSINLPDLEAGATYEVQVRAITSDEGEGPWSDVGEGRANRPPNTSALSLVDQTIPWGSSHYATLPALFEDADGDPRTFSASATNPGIVKIWLTSTVMHWTMRNPGTATVTYGAHDPYGGYVSRTVDYTAVENTTRSVPENSAAGTSVGRTVQGVPHPPGTVYTHTLSGDAADSGAFVIDATTGQISVKQGATLDYETKSSYAGKVSWVVLGQTSVANVTINVTDLEAGKPGTPTLTRTRFSEPTDPALDVAWTAAAANGTTISAYQAQYRKKVADGETANAWTDYTVDDGNDGQTSALPATTTSINLPDLEAGATYEVQVRAITSDEGEGPWSDVGEGRANRPPNTSALSSRRSDHPVGLFSLRDATRALRGRRR